MEGIYIGGRSIRTFGAKLRTDYTISGPSPSRTLRREPRTGSFSLLDTGWGLLTLKLPMDFYGGSRGEIAWNMAGLRGLLQKETEIDLGDGFLYRCVLTAAGSESWTGRGFVQSEADPTGHPPWAGAHRHREKPPEAL